MTAYATLSEFRAYLRPNTSQVLPAGDDAFLTDLIERASRLLDRLTDRVFAADAVTTRNFDALADVDGQFLMFDCNYCAGITSVVNGDGTAIAAADYVTEPRNGGPFYGMRLKLGGSEVWTWSDSPEDAIAVTGYWCYSKNTDGTVDDDTTHMTIRLAAWLYRQATSGVDLDRPLVTGDGVTVLPAGLPHDLAAWIDVVRRRL